MSSAALKRDEVERKPTTLLRVVNEALVQTFTAQRAVVFEPTKR